MQTTTIQNSFNPKELAILTIAAFTASGQIPQLIPRLHQGLNAGLTINQVKAILIQMYAYAGFPRSLNGLSALMSVIQARQHSGIHDIVGKDIQPFPEQNSLDVGTVIQTSLIGQKISGPLFEFAPTIDFYLKSHLFGDIFQSDVLTWKERELATIAALANMQGVNSQLQAHLSISLNNGVSPAQLQAFIDILHTECSEDVSRNAKQVLSTVLNPTTAMI